MLPDNVLLYGKEEALPEIRVLRAGPLRVEFEAGDLRRIRLGGREVVRRVYVAVRDANWSTIPGVIQDLSVSDEGDHFEIRYQSEHRQREIHFLWTALIRGGQDGSIRFSMSGKAITDFRKNRIGFCVHHPLEGLAGEPCVIEQADGRRMPDYFPRFVAPHQPFLNVQAMTHSVLPGVEAEVRFEGEIFETEDHRNWTDANYKTYGTPLSLPYPVAVKAGEEIRQAVVLTLKGDATAAIASDRGDLQLRVTGKELALPKIGLGLGSHGAELSETEVRLLRQCSLSHLRCEPGELPRAGRAAKALGVPLEVEVDLARATSATLEGLVHRANTEKVTVCRWLLYDGPAGVPGTEKIALARQFLKSAPLIIGSNAYFTQVNRNRPNPDEIDGACFSVNPQVHAFDNRSLAENCAAQRDAVESARRFLGDRPVFVTPVTLKMRFNPDATGAVAPEPEGELPPPVDPRQMSLFGACWTLSSLCYLAEGGAAGITYYETNGWRGLMESAAGSLLPSKFHSAPGMVFPMWHVFAEAGEFKDGTASPVETSDALLVDGLRLRTGERERILLANLSAEPQKAQLRGLSSGTWLVRTLDKSTAWEAMTKAENSRSQKGVEQAVKNGTLSLQFGPYALLVLDRQEEGKDA